MKYRVGDCDTVCLMSGMNTAVPPFFFFLGGGGGGVDFKYIIITDKTQYYTTQIELKKNNIYIYIYIYCTLFYILSYVK